MRRRSRAGTRCPERLQRADLHGRGVCAQEPAALEIQRVVHVHCRMIGRKVQRAEVVPLVLGLGPGRDREAQITEDRLDFLHHDRDGVLGTAPLAASGHREIDRGRRGRHGGELGAPRDDGLLELLLYGVEQRTKGWAILRRQLRDVRLVVIQPAARTPERCDACVLDVIDATRFRELLEVRPTKLFQPRTQFIQRSGHSCCRDKRSRECPHTQLQFVFIRLIRSIRIQKKSGASPSGS